MARRTVALYTALVVFVAAVAVGGYFGLRGLFNSGNGCATDSCCNIGDYELDTDQAVVAAQMVGEVSKFRPALPDRAAVLVLAAGLQESQLRNLAPGEGDRDSVGVLQQRPSQGWGGGDPAKLNDVTVATRLFLNALVTHPGWEHQPLAKAIDEVQISVNASYYATWETEARVLARALLGRVPEAITCSFAKPTLVAPTHKVITQLRAQVPVNRPAAHGRSIRVPGAAWQTVAWFVANADRLGIDSVQFAHRRWSRDAGWTDGPGGRGVVVATMATL